MDVNFLAGSTALNPIHPANAYPRLARVFPFLRWWPMVSRDTLRADAIAGLTVAMILIPQSMAYAQLAGMPAFYGLPAAFLPVLIGALWGSSHQLATGPVAMVALLTGSSLAQFATPGQDQFIAMAITLALMVGVFQFTLGVFRLGAIISFLSHPVIVGFTNAAAIIIALSQLNKFIGVPLVRTDQFLLDVWGVLRRATDAHWPTLAFGLAALTLMLLLRRYRPLWPGVLIAVALATLVSWGIEFERGDSAQAAQFDNANVRTVIEVARATRDNLAEVNREISEKSNDMQQFRQRYGEDHPRALALRHDIEFLRLQMRGIERERDTRLAELHSLRFERVPSVGGAASRFYLEGQLPASVTADARRWQVERLDQNEITLKGGGNVIGAVPAGLPKFSWPGFNFGTLATLFATALVITLVGFMEAISIAKAMATQTRQRIDPNQELIGQGLANVAGSLTQSFPVSGSFSRSAVNLSAGARTGMSSVFTVGVVLLTLLLFTPALYHLPQSVLAAIILLAVINLVNFKGLIHAWHAHHHDGIAAFVTFIATLAFAPQLEAGILVGGGLAILLYLYRTMRPRVAVLSRHPDGRLRDAQLHNLPTSDYVIAIRFDGSLYFANVPYFEDLIMNQVARRPKAKFVLIVGDAINELDASGATAIRDLVHRMRDIGVTLVFSGLKQQVEVVVDNTELDKVIGADNIFRNDDQAIESIHSRITDPDFSPARCPLHIGERRAPREPRALNAPDS